MERGSRQINGSHNMHGIGNFHTMSSGLDSIGRLFRNAHQASHTIVTQHEQSRAIGQEKTFGSFVADLTKIVGKIQGSSGVAVDGAIRQFIDNTQQAGGGQISKEDLHRYLGDLHKSIGRTAAVETGIDGELLKELTRGLKETKNNVVEKGVNALRTSGVGTTSKKFQSSKELDEARGKLASEVRKIGKTLSDPVMRRAIDEIRGKFHRSYNTAKTSDEKKAAFAIAKEEVQQLFAGRSREIPDENKLKKISTLFGEAKEGPRQSRLNAFASKFQAGWNKVSAALGATIRVLGPLKKTFDVGNAIFQQVNSQVNKLSRVAIGATAERGALGRLMRGSGMNFSSMMSAINTGRRAGMDDREVVERMSSLQEQLARARWGEGNLIENLGKWGMTPFDENGGMKDFNRVMIDISRTFNSLGSDMERLQFLSMQGFKPEQMEYVRDYEKNYKQWEEIKRTPHLQGVLESARILDESGMSARVDAATKMEMRRREILNQNAADEGLWEGFKRSIHPENWLFNDWTARQQGIASAKSDIAMEKLAKELQEVQKALSKNSNALQGNTAGLINLSPEALQALSLSGGWAEADIKNKGDKSAVQAMRALYAQKMGTRNLTEVEREKDTKANTALATGLGVAGVAGIGLLAALAGLVSFGTGTLAVLGLATAAGLGGGIGGYEYFKNSKGDDGTKKHVEELRKLRGNTKAIYEYAEKYGLSGITPEMIESEDFKDDEKAVEAVKGAFNVGLLQNAQKLSNRKIDIAKAMEYRSDKFFLANEKAAKALGKETPAEKRHHEAIARKGTGDDTIGIDAETAYNYIKYGFDEYSPETKAKINEEIGRLRSKYKREGNDKAYNKNVLKEEALENVRKEFQGTITPETYQQAKIYAKEKGLQRAIIEENIAQNIKASGSGASAMHIKEFGLDEISKLARDPEAAQKAYEEFLQSFSYQHGLKRGGADEKSVKAKKALLETAIEASKYGSLEAYLDSIGSKESFEEMVFGKGEKGFAYFTDEEKRKAIADMGRTVGIGETTDEHIAKAVQDELAQKDKEGLDAKARAMRKAEEYFADDEVFKNLSQEEQQAELNDKAAVFLEAERQEAEMGVREESDRMKEITAGMTAGEKLSYLAMKGKSKGISKDDIANYQLSDQEVEAIEAKLTEGMELTAEEKERYDIWKLGSKNKNRERQKEIEKKRVEEEERKKKAATAVEDDFAKLFGEEMPSETEIPKTSETESVGEAEAAVAPTIPIGPETVAEPGQAKEKPSEKVDLTPHDIAVMRMAQARGKDLRKAYSDAQIEAFNKKEEEEKKKYVDRHIGTEDEYGVFKRLETKQLRGEELQEDEAEIVKSTRSKLDKTAPLSKRKPLHEKYELTEEERAAREEVERKSSQLKAEQEEWLRKRNEEKALSLAGRSGEDATAIMQAKEEGVAQVVQKMESAGLEAESAAASAKNLIGGGAAVDNKVTINLGGQTITQNIHGEYPMDSNGMKRGTLEGASEIRDRTAEIIVSATKSMGKY